MPQSALALSTQSSVLLSPPHQFHCGTCMQVSVTLTFVLKAPIAGELLRVAHSSYGGKAFVCERAAFPTGLL